jgi:hypothetical protein
MKIEFDLKDLDVQEACHIINLIAEVIDIRPQNGTSLPVPFHKAEVRCDPIKMGTQFIQIITKLGKNQ